MLSQNVERHPKDSTIQPPMFGPMMLPMGKMLVNNPIACGREFGNASLTMDVATGRILPMPVACKNRPEMRTPMFGARAHIKDPMVKTPMETR
jgi:hypothetical protein